MLLVTGATGHLGSSVVKQLLKISTKEEFIATSSNPEGIGKLSSKGLQVRLANFSDPTTLHTAFKGVDKLLLISTMDQNRLQQHKNVVDAAKAQGVKHIVYTGLAIKDIHTSGVKDLMISHFETEDYIKASGLTYTFARNTMYADALSQILGANALHHISLPGGDGKVPYALRREMGEAIANLLLQEGHENKTYNITGTKSVGYAELAEVISTFSSNPVHYHNIGEDEFKQVLKQAGFPDFAIYLHAGTIYDIKSHQYEIISTALELLLGRPPASVEECIKELFNIKK